MNYLGSYHTLHLHKTTVLLVALDPSTGLVLLVIKVSSPHTIRHTHTHN